MSQDLKTTPLYDKTLGCLLGGLIGDAIGTPTEGKDYRQIQAQFGWVDDFDSDGTDDTVMKNLLAEALIRTDGYATLDDWAQVWLDRWDAVVHMDYLPAKEEIRLLRSRHPSLGRDLLKRVVKAAGDLRKAHAEEQLTTAISTRRLLAMCARIERGNDFQRALTVCVLNKVPPEDVKVIRETFDHHVGTAAQPQGGA